MLASKIIYGITCMVWMHRRLMNSVASSLAERLQPFLYLASLSCHCHVSTSLSSSQMGCAPGRWTAVTWRGAMQPASLVAQPDEALHRHLTTCLQIHMQQSSSPCIASKSGKVSK